MQRCVRTSYQKYDIRKGSFDDGWKYLQRKFVDRKSFPNLKCSSCENIRFYEHCVANFVLVYGDEEIIDLFFCLVAELRRYYVEGKMIKEIQKSILQVRNE